MTTDGTSIEANRHYRTKRDFLNVQRRVWQAIYNSGNFSCGFFSCGLLQNVSMAFNNFSWKEPANTEFLKIADELQTCLSQTTRTTTEP